MTESRTGAWAGALAVSLVSAIVLGAGVGAASLFAPTSILAPLATVAVCVGLAAILGGLAGALAFASNSKALPQQLRAHIDLRHPVVIVHAATKRPRSITKFGPISSGVIH